MSLTTRKSAISKLHMVIGELNNSILNIQEVIEELRLSDDGFDAEGVARKIEGALSAEEKNLQAFAESIRAAAASKGKTTSRAAKPATAKAASETVTKTATKTVTKRASTAAKKVAKPASKTTTKPAAAKETATEKATPKKNAVRRRRLAARAEAEAKAAAKPEAGLEKKLVLKPVPERRPAVEVAPEKAPEAAVPKAAPEEVVITPPKAPAAEPLTLDSNLRVQKEAKPASAPFILGEDMKEAEVRPADPLVLTQPQPKIEAEPLILTDFVKKTD